MKFTIHDGLHVERLEDEVLVLVPGKDEVLRLRNTEAEAFELAAAGIDVVPTHLETAMAGLVELGIVQTSQWSRRRVIQLGGAAAAAAIAVTALPSVAAADSTPAPPQTGNGNLLITLNFYDGTKNQIGLPADVPSNSYLADVYSSDPGNPPPSPMPSPAATSTLTAKSGQKNITIGFSNLAPGTYYFDIDEPFATAGQAALDAYAGTGHTFSWNQPYQWAGNNWTPGGPPGAAQSWGRFQAVTVTANSTATYAYSVQVRVDGN